MKNLFTKTNSIHSILTLIFCFLFGLQINAQSISSASPDNASLGDRLNVFISGNSTNFLNGSSSIQTKFKQGSTSINASSPVSVNSAGDLLEVNLNLSNTTYPTGFYDIEVNTPAHGILTLTNGFRIDTTALKSATPQVGFKGNGSLNVLIIGQAIDFTNVTVAPYYFRNSDTIRTTIVSPRTRGTDTLELNVDLTSTSIRSGNYDFRLMTAGGPLFLRNALEVITTSIVGTVFHDINQNGIKDSGEVGVRNVKLTLLPPKLTANTYWNNGNYEFTDLAADTYQVILEPPFWATGTGASDTQTVIVNALDTFDASFGVIPTQQNSTIIKSYSGRARCNADITYRIYISNQGATSSSGVYYFVKDSLITYDANTISAADSVKGDTIYYSYENLKPFAFDRRFPTKIRCNLPSLTVLPINSVLKGYSYIYLTDSMANIIAGSDTNHTTTTVVRCAYDPNDKAVSPVGIDSLGYVKRDTPLEYTIRFQNTGNDTAYRVVLLDTLSNDLDWTSFELLEASHAVITQLDSNGYLEFAFDNIFLVDSFTNEPGSNGFVSFGISPKAGLADSTQVFNRAAIYFDFNPPIITNQVVTTFANLFTSLTENKERLRANIAPNPTNGRIKISLEKHIQNGVLSIYDLNGRVVHTENQLNGKKQEIDLSALSNGIYILSIQEAGKIYVEKLILEK